MYCSMKCKRTASRAYMYGLTIPEFLRLFVEADGCAVCGDRAELVIDHCHETGEVRGLLCGQCNVGLGMFKDSVARMLAGIDYLRRWAAKPAATVVERPVAA